MSYVLISHDLAVVRQLAEQVIVLWQGQIVEQGQTGEVLDNPRHEYTQRLRASVPRPGWRPARRRRISHSEWSRLPRAPAPPLPEHPLDRIAVEAVNTQAAAGYC